LSLIIAGFAAKGEAIIGRAYHLNRAFERIEEKGCRVNLEHPPSFTPRDQIGIPHWSATQEVSLSEKVRRYTSLPLAA
jgi:hypothetical protein